MFLVFGKTADKKNRDGWGEKVGVGRGRWKWGVSLFTIILVFPFCRSLLYNPCVFVYALLHTNMSEFTFLASFLLSQVKHSCHGILRCSFVYLCFCVLYYLGIGLDYWYHHLHLQGGGS